ncbi:peptidoglycan-binding protein [Pseudenhygromyxa sp. WMMC2535]|uniref:peptidoglycan-binding protein n=1 Tax=Pseudenhygromyxa sp. WMMC2535 TaxID=2712867 RepID=UPI001557EF36|nr:peptidoglycan-binding protein [Pseudenhygromyxa sp. WMMC2535]NVB38209.1 peptidoglycan-binding protein [Pseudenhygromyxa sp. WMMC2535]NVB41608.1 peptidoglycan-binding protein [Pseudenhygromyxa sp. WMMC2535]NVB43632.1 peptidoglycan-binding protein [Pseudenhygromyxa sp. WMMC2535]NVB43657.1 peptidoglycan-binding protein [Pseudenhygromyxa sp. WMMC2535]
MNSRRKLEALGYGTTAKEMERFQRDYNRLPPKRLLPLTGRFDAATAKAIDLAYEVRTMFILTRDGD